MEKVIEIHFISNFFRVKIYIALFYSFLNQIPLICNIITNICVNFKIKKLQKC